jgi:hypothetical protein
MIVLICKWCEAKFSFEEDLKTCHNSPWWGRLLHGRWHKWVRKAGS